MRRKITALIIVAGVVLGLVAGLGLGWFRRVTLPTVLSSWAVPGGDREVIKTTPLAQAASANQTRPNSNVTQFVWRFAALMPMVAYPKTGPMQNDLDNLTNDPWFSTAGGRHVEAKVAVPSYTRGNRLWF